MEKETGHKMWELATTIEYISIEIEQLQDLLQVYSEHREQELKGVTSEEPLSVTFLLQRQGMGEAILDALKTKVHYINGQIEQATNTGFEIALAVKASTEQ